MELISNEKIIAVSNGDKLTLTTHRVRYEYSNASFFDIIISMIQGNFGDPSKRNLSFVSIFLEQISSIEYRYKSRPIFLILSLICFIGGVYKQFGNNYDDKNSFFAGVIIALLFLIIFFLTRKSAIAINTALGSAIVIISSSHRDTVASIITQIEQSKSDRLNYLHGGKKEFEITPLQTRQNEKKCSNCGTNNDINDTFCMSCGSKLK